MKNKTKISFVGGGNMGEALIAGLLSKKTLHPSQIGVFEPDPIRKKKLKSRYRITVFPSNRELIRHSESILLAVKPQQMEDVLQEIREDITPKHLVISIAAGLDTNYFLKRLSKKTRFVRVMPNLGSLIGEGAAALYAARTAKQNDKDFAKKIFSASGKVVFVRKESQLDTVTALSGSGPAFVFSFANALMESATKRGLPKPMARELTLQTLLGATRMMELSKDPLSMMIDRVASKGGTTEAGLKVLSKMNFTRIIDQTIGAATERAEQLRKIMP